MGKMKVHELAKELDIQSKDVVTFLQTKGYEVKAAQSSVEEDAVAMVKKEFRQKKEQTENQKEKPAESKVQSAEGVQDQPKKKKIIFVSNPQNSKMSGGSKTSQQGRPVQNKSQVQTKPPVQQEEKKERKPVDVAAMFNQALGIKPEVKQEAKPVQKSEKSPFSGVSILTESKVTAVKETAAKSAEMSIAEVKQDATAQAQTKQAETKQTEARTTEPGHSGNQTAPRGQETSADSTVRRNTDTYQRQTNTGRDNSQNRQGQDSQNRYQGQGNQQNRTGYNQNRYQNNGQGNYQNRYQNNNQGNNNQGNNNQNSNAQGSYNQNSGQTRSGYQNRTGQTQSGRPYQNTGERPSYGNDQRGGQGTNRTGTGTGQYQNRTGAGAGQYQNRTGTGTGQYQNRTGAGTGQYQNRTGTGTGQYQNRTGTGTGQYQNRTGTQGANRTGGGYGGRSYQGNSGAPGGNRGYNNSERPDRGNDRENNQYRKQTPVKSTIPDSAIKDTEKHRDEKKRIISQEKDKRSKKDKIYEDESAALKNKNKAGRFIKPEKKLENKMEEVIKVIIIPEVLTIKELAEKMRLQPSAIVKKLFLQGKIVTVNQEIPFETAEEIAIEYDIICEREVKVDVIEELLKEEDDALENLITRPPVICVMGHVDHGKTSLLDAIRKTNVTDREAGGITQHIGAYTVTVKNEKITFLDTPGHEAFTSMRMRGANATDIAILVVAADDGVMPQTIEAINHAKAAGINIIVAVNKIDKPNANVDRVKQELAEYDLIPEDWGGSTVFALVSAKSGEGIEQLLEMILLTAEILELKANPDRKARGLVIEAELDKGRGPVATVLVQKGKLLVGDFISAGACYGKVRAMVDDKGRRVKEAGPSTPVEILGLSDVPNAGDVFLSHENDKTAKTYAETFVSQNKEKMLEDTKAKMSLDDLFTQIKAGNLKELNIIVKADVQGSVEAVKQSLLKLSNDEVVVKCIHGGVGAINESDVILASASNAIIIGFNVRPDTTAKATGEREGVDVRLYKVIYQAIEDVEAAMKGMLDPVYEEKIIAHAEVRQIFKASAIGNIAGSFVLDGTFTRGCKVRISRMGTQIFEGGLLSLKRFKDDVKEVKAGFECGFVFDGFDQMQELDIVEAYIMVEVPR